MTLANIGPGTKTLSTFPRDHHQRRRLFVEDSFQHQAKSNLYQLSWILNRFTNAGNIVLDPMGGTGSTLFGATMQRMVIIGEIEDYWLSILKRNKERISSLWLFTSPMMAYQGDAMNLPFCSGAISAIVTSPPYWDTFSDWHISSKMGRQLGPYGPAFGDDRGRETKRNIGNIHIYEDYLRTMAIVYLEIHRVLKNKGPMVLILKDRIHKGARVPIVEDTIALCVAMGFSLFEKFAIQTRASQFRTLYRQQNPDGPRVTSEIIAVMRKYPPAGLGGRKIAIIEGIGPKMKLCTGQAVISFFTSPVFRKIMAYIRTQADMIYILVAKQGFVPLEQDVIDFDPQLGKAKANVRREWVFDIVRDHALKGTFRTGDQVTLCVSQRYTRYLRQRLETFGCEVKEPLKGLNLGQQLAWLTEKGF